MHRRRFCTHALGAGIAAALPATASLSVFAATQGPQGDVHAVSVDGKELTIERAAALEFQQSLKGPVLFPGDEGYEHARHVWNGMVDKHPAIIAQCANSNDVSKAVIFAAERQMLLSVKGGGHSYPGKCVAERGLMIDLGTMNRVVIDAKSKTAEVQGGALLGDLEGPALEQNLVTTAGVVSHTGVGGFTLGGGMGRTDRVHGLAVDNVLGATLVTADGKVRHLGPEENEDLYWAIRGGGGNFGAVTEFTFRLHPFNPQIYGGSLYYLWPQVKDVLTYWADINDELPDAASVEPQIYVNDDGNREMELQLYYAGPPADGERVFAQFANTIRPDYSDLGLKSYRAVQTMWDEPLGHGNLNYIKSGLLPKLTPAVIDAVVESYEGDDLPSAFFQHLGGASARVDPQATAYPHRRVHSNYGITAHWTDPSITESRIEAIRQVYAAMEPHMQGYYANLDEDSSPANRNYGVNYDRLVRIKSEYDPANLFRLNANIEPGEKMS